MDNTARATVSRIDKNTCDVGNGPAASGGNRAPSAISRADIGVTCWRGLRCCRHGTVAAAGSGLHEHACTSTVHGHEHASTVHGPHEGTTSSPGRRCGHGRRLLGDDESATRRAAPTLRAQNFRISEFQNFRISEYTRVHVLRVRRRVGCIGVL